MTHPELEVIARRLFLVWQSLERPDKRLFELLLGAPEASDSSSKFDGD